MSKFHKIPFSCRFWCFFMTPSPSAMFCKCALGRHHRTRKCPGCEANTGETLCEAILEGFANGLKSPKHWRISADGKTIYVYSNTTEKENTEK